MLCSYCDRPLDCSACRTEYDPSSEAYYEAMNRPEVPLICEACGATLICHWCRTPYDGQAGEDGESDE